MCLIFQKKVDAPLITRAWCKDVWLRNDDGWGIAYHKPSTGALVVRTGLEFPDFWNTFASLQRLPIDIIVHMRMGTQGAMDESNLHPFLVSERHNIWFMHNGVVDYPEGDEYEDFEAEFCSMEEQELFTSPYGTWTNERPSWCSGSSDTNLLVKRMLTPMLNNMVNAKEFIRSQGFAFLMEKIGGSYGNKFTFHDDDGHIILDEADWSETTTGIPVSNTYAFSLDKKPPVGYVVGNKQNV